MQSRLVGTDAGLNMIANASDSIVGNSAKAAANANETTANYLTQSQQRAKQLLDLQSSVDATKASRQGSGGFASAVDSVGKLLIQREQEKAKAEQLKQQQVDVLKGTRLKAAIGNNEQKIRVEQKQAEAQAKLTKEQQEEQQLLLRGDVEARLTSLYQSETGVETYRSQASQIISDAINQGLTPKDTVELMRTVNDTATKRYDGRGERIAKEQQKLQDARVDQLSAALQVKLQVPLATIANLPPTEQAAPYLASVENTIKQVLADQSLTDEQRYRISTQALSLVQKSYGVKAEAFAKLNTNLNQMSGYIGFMRQARAQFEADGNLDAYKGKQEYAKTVYGNWEDSIAQPGEVERLQAQTASDINSRQKIIQEGQERLGARLDITADETQMLTKRMLSNPAYLSQMERTPEFKDNASVRAAVTLAKRYQMYVKDKADLEDWKASNGVKYANLNLNIANNRAQLIERMARVRAAQAKGKELTPEQATELEFNKRVLQNMPELQFIVDGMAEKLNSGGKVDPVELKRAADLSEQGIIGVINSITTEQQTKERTLIDRYGDLQQYNLLRPIDQLTKEADRDQKALDSKVENWSNVIRQQQTQQMQPSQYGQQSPFDSTSTYGADVDARGLVKLAPRQRLNTITHNGSKIVTPIVAGSNAPLTSAWHSSRDGGRRRHAGIDFGANAGVPSVALVGGQVVHIDVNSGGYGGYMDILGDNGYVYRYGHQGSFKFKKGQRVRAGDIVSISDGSGAGDPHLHFEVHGKPQFVNGKYQPQFGESPTVDPIEHLRKLSANDSSVLMPRINNRAAARANPRVKVPNNAAVYPQGSALMANQVQFVGGQARPAANVYNSQRPVRNGTLPWNVGDPSSIRYDYDDDFGYSKLRSNTKLRKSIVSAAKELKIPAYWIADIIRQESGANMSHTTVHNGGSNYGLFGFGGDSFNDVSVGQMKRMDEAQQMQLMVRYMKENGWMKHLQKRGGQASIADFWAIMRMGTAWRKRALADPVGFLNQRLDDTSKTWGYEVGLLGKWAGRTYSVPGKSRRDRNASVNTNEHAACKLCQQMVASGSSILPHAHDIG